MKHSILYLVGAGRSGTTLLASILNTHPSILTVGEMHLFLTYYFENKQCSCGEPLNRCEFWSDTIKGLTLDPVNDSNYNEIDKKHHHRHIAKLLFTTKKDKNYTHTHEKIFDRIRLKSNAPWTLDSSKYIGRYLLLKQNNNLNIKGIFLVRDVRGVINSFEKKVQTPKKPMATIIYYNLINLAGELVHLLNKDIIKVRYEDLIEDTDRTVKDITHHIFNRKSGVQFSGDIVNPHIIGGNRMVKQRTIKIDSTIAWKLTMKRHKQILYYLLCLPLMLINKYKI